MRAITLTQPWATLVARGYKKVETRSWSTQHRGPIAIHAAKTFPSSAQNLMWREPFLSDLREAGAITWDLFYGPAGAARATLPLGAVIATAKLGDVWKVERLDQAARWGLSAAETEYGDYSPGRYAWFLYDIEPLPEPCPAKGALGLWEWRGATP